MPVKGGNRIRAEVRRKLASIAGPQTNKAVTEALIIGEGYAVKLTPVDTANLVNSRFRYVRQQGRGYLGRLGFTADYAVAVHEGPERNWQKAGAETEFLRKAFEEEGRDEIIKHLKRSYRL